MKFSCLSAGSGNFVVIADKTQALVARHPRLFPVKIPKVAKWNGMRIPARGYRSLPFNLRVRLVSVTPGKSLLTAGSLPHSRVINAIIKSTQIHVQAHMHRVI